MSDSMSDSIRDAFDDGVESVGRNVRDGADKAARHMHDGLEEATGLFDHGAEVVDDSIRSTRKKMSNAGRRAAGAFNDSTEYFRTNGPRGVMRDVEDLMKQHPGKALVAFAAVGFLLGRSLKSRR